MKLGIDEIMLIAVLSALFLGYVIGGNRKK